MGYKVKGSGVKGKDVNPKPSSGVLRRHVVDPTAIRVEEVLPLACGFW